MVGSGSGAAEPQAAVKGQVTLENATEKRLLAFRGGFFDYTTHDFKAVVGVELRDGERGSLEVSGKVEDGRMNARIEAAGFAQNALSVELLRDGPVAEASRLETHMDAASGGDVGAVEYTGQARFTTGELRTVTLTVVRHPSTSPDLKFYEGFLPVRWVDATLTMGQTTVEFMNAELDPRAGTLTGRLQSGSGGDRAGFDVSLVCRAAGGDGWSCRYLSNRMGQLLTVDFTRSAQ
jgi:hypothetical protein